MTNWSKVFALGMVSGAFSALCGMYERPLWHGLFWAALMTAMASALARRISKDGAA